MKSFVNTVNRFYSLDMYNLTVRHISSIDDIDDLQKITGKFPAVSLYNHYNGYTFIVTGLEEEQAKILKMIIDSRHNISSNLAEISKLNMPRLDC